MPGIKDDDKPQQILTAIMIQNGFHDKNSHRVDAIAQGKYYDFKSSMIAQIFLGDQLSNLLLNRLRSAEAKLLSVYQKEMSGDLARKILVAPDVFHAALLMKTNQIYFGKGDFKSILDILKTEKSESFKDIARKLAMLKDGYLYRDGIQVDLNLDEGMRPIDASQIPES